MTGALKETPDVLAVDQGSNEQLNFADKVSTTTGDGQAVASLNKKSKLEWALYLASLGFRIFPLIEGTKNPGIDAWQNKASSDPKHIRDWWVCRITGWPQNHNIGVTGGLFLDIDVKNDAPGMLNLKMFTDKYGALPSTFTVKTPSGGQHHYFQNEPGVKNSAGSLARGIDVRAYHGYVVGVGSTFPLPKGPDGEMIDIEYAVIDDSPVAVAPEWLVDRAKAASPSGRDRDRAKRGHTAEGVTLDHPDAISRAHQYLTVDAINIETSGIGNIITFKTAARVKDFGISRDKCMEMLDEIWNTRNIVPRSDSDLAKEVDNAYGYGGSEIGCASWENDFTVWTPGPDDPPSPIGSMSAMDGMIFSPCRNEHAFDEVPHVVARWVPEGEVTLFSGHGGSGKSYVSLSLAVHVALGLPFGQLRTTQTRVLFFSAEDGQRIIQHRLARLCQTMGIDQTRLDGWLFPMDASNADTALHREQRTAPGGQHKTTTAMLDTLGKLVKKLDVGLVVIDNASDTYDGDEIRRATVRSFVRSLRSQLAYPGRAVLLLSHVNKLSAASGKNGGTEAYSGSTAWHNSVRSRLSLIPSDGDSMLIEHGKANLGPKAKPVRLDWRDGVPIVAQPAPQDDGSESDKDEADKSAILALIADFDRRGERVTVSTSGPGNLFRTLSPARDFPTGVDAPRLTMLIREMESTGRVFRRTITTPDRKKKEVFTLREAV
ncbi:MAG: AAA family ATPase [Magnetococcales bacterium]|nr:AAA family ATPase [Magnetococcales bacterium]